MKICYSCQHQFLDKYQAFRSSLCPSCGKDVKVCKNCKFYSPSSQNQCREHIQDPVKDKERANFCDYFVFVQAKENESSKKESSAKDDFNNLFI